MGRFVDGGSLASEGVTLERGTIYHDHEDDMWHAEIDTATLGPE